MYPWRFKTHVPNNYWNEVTNRRRAFQYICDELHVNDDLQKLYNVTRSLLTDHGLGGLVSSHYSGSPQAFIQSMLTSEQWAELRPWKFESGAPQGYWNDPDHCRYAFETLRDEIGATTDITRWYTVTTDYIRSVGLGSMVHLSHYGGPKGFLKAFMATDEWEQIDERKFGTVSAQECWCLDVLRQQPHIFEIIGADCLDRRRTTFSALRYRWDFLVRHTSTGFIFVIEVDGEQHFFNDINQRRRDREKLDFLTAEPPDCVDKIHFICRISYQQRRRGHAAIRELLSRVVASSMDGFVCLKDDGMMYDADGMPRILSGQS